MFNMSAVSAPSHVISSISKSSSTCTCTVRRVMSVLFCSQYLALTSKCCCPGKCGSPPGMDLHFKNSQSYLLSVKCIWGSRDGTVVENSPPMHASHQCGPGSIPGLSVKCGLSLLLVLVLAPRGFSPGTPVFTSPQKPTFLNSNSIWNSRATGLSVVLLSVTLVK